MTVQERASLAIEHPSQDEVSHETEPTDHENRVALSGVEFTAELEDHADEDEHPEHEDGQARNSVVGVELGLPLASTENQLTSPTRALPFAFQNLELFFDVVG